MKNFCIRFSIIFLVMIASSCSQLPGSSSQPNERQDESSDLVTNAELPTMTKTIVPSQTLPPTSTPIPTETSLPTFTKTPVPTKTTTPSITPIPDTIPGSILQPGDVWHQNGMEMRLKNPTFLPGCHFGSQIDRILGFEITIINNTGGELVTNIYGLDFTISDNEGEMYPEVDVYENPPSGGCGYIDDLSEIQIVSMAKDERIDRYFQVDGSLGKSTTQFIVTVYQAGRIQNAVWAIDVPR